MTKKEFTDGNYYPDNLPQLAAELRVSEQQLVDWFEKRRDIWKKEQATMAYSRMAELQETQQEDIEASQAPLSDTTSPLPEPSNVPLAEQLLSDASNQPTLSLLSIDQLPEVSQAPLSDKTSSLPELSNVALAKQLLSDASNQPTLSLLDIDQLPGES